MFIQSCTATCNAYLNKQGLVFVGLIRLDLDDPLGFGLEGVVSPERLLQGRCIAAQLVCVLLSHLADPESPAIVGACKRDIA